MEEDIRDTMTVSNIVPTKRSRKLKNNLLTVEKLHGHRVEKIQKLIN